jgi:hypothetical protein
MGWANPPDPVKLIQSNPKKWGRLGNWVDMVLKTKNPYKNSGYGSNPDSDSKTHLTRF